MHRVSQYLVTGFAALLIAAAPLDTIAVIGTTRGHAFEIIVRTDGLATLYSGFTPLRTFELPSDAVARLFTAVVAAREDDVQNVTCAEQRPVMKVRVAWHGWYSADVTCEPHTPQTSILWHSMLLGHAALAVVVLAGRPAAIPCYELPKDERPRGCVQ
jgi:hypothetical protein